MQKKFDFHSREAYAQDAIKKAKLLEGPQMPLRGQSSFFRAQAMS